MEEWVFIDTCIWVSFFAKPGSREKAAVDDLLDSDRVALLGPVLAEVLLGFRRKDQANWVASRLRMAHYVEANWSVGVLPRILAAILLRRETSSPCRTCWSPRWRCAADLGYIAPIPISTPFQT